MQAGIIFFLAGGRKLYQWKETTGFNRKYRNISTKNQ